LRREDKGESNEKDREREEKKVERDGKENKGRGGAKEKGR